MSLDPATIQALAARLHEAEQTRVQTRQFSLEHPGMGFEDAYAIQDAWVAMKIAEGRTLKGHKIGLTSKAMQRFSNINEPDYGALLSDMFFQDGGEIPAGRFIDPRVEVELAFILKDRLSGPDCTLYDVLNATEFVVPAIEIIDAASSGWTARPAAPARCSTPSATTPPTPPSCSAAGRSAPWTWTCAGSRRS